MEKNSTKVFLPAVCNRLRCALFVTVKRRFVILSLKNIGPLPVYLNMKDGIIEAHLPKSAKKKLKLAIKKQLMRCC